MPSPANLLTDFILRQSYADLPEPIRHQAKRCLLDSMGALSAGAVTPLARLTARTAERFFQGGECTLIASGRKVSPLGASMANGFASNALDVEHGYRPAQGRPGAALTPVMLAAAEMAETPPSGTDMLAAVAVGYEVGMRSGMYWNRDHARVYTSGLWGAIGAVAAAGRILGLKEDVLLQALNCADYHGPVGFIARGVATPCMAKDGVGWGAHTAMMSILLAQAGFTSPLLDFDAALAEELGSRWRMADLYFKPYCCCRWAPAAIGPYSQAVDTGSTVYLSGQIGQDPASGQIVTGFKAQTIQALENLKAVLAAAGMTLDNMAQVDVFVTDMRNFEDFNAIYSTYFPAYKPARLFVEVRGLCPGAEVEIRGIACRR